MDYCLQLHDWKIVIKFQLLAELFTVTVLITSDQLEKKTLEVRLDGFFYLLSLHLHVTQVHTAESCSHLPVV